MPNDINIRWGWLKFMYWYTIVGAGGFGLGMIIRLTWSNPVGTYDQIRIVIWDNDLGLNVLHAKLPNNVEELVIPGEWVEIFDEFYGISDPVWQVQTRSYDAQEINYTRGISNWEPIP